MTIDTNDITSWLQKHLLVVIPIGLVFLSWFAATRWQAALTDNQKALQLFYFFLSAVSGIVAAVLTIFHLIRLGLFNKE